MEGIESLCVRVCVREREIRIAVGMRDHALAMQLVVNEDSREYTTASQRLDTLTMTFAIFESSNIT